MEQLPASVLPSAADGVVIAHDDGVDDKRGDHETDDGRLTTMRMKSTRAHTSRRTPTEAAATTTDTLHSR